MIRDEDLDFFRPLPRRIGVTLFLTLWSLYEWLAVNSAFWGTLTGACAVYCYYRLFLTYPEKK